MDHRLHVFVMLFFIPATPFFFVCLFMQEVWLLALIMA